MNKHCIFFLLLLGLLFACIILSIIAPFFPPFASSHHISDALIGLIFSCNPIGDVLASLLSGKLITHVNIPYSTILAKQEDHHDKRPNCLIPRLVPLLNHLLL